MKLALGTVQFGLNYGVSNRSGKTKTDEVKRILKLAKSASLNTIDTAAAYGDAEAVLGNCAIDDFNAFTVGYGCTIGIGSGYSTCNDIARRNHADRPQIQR